MPWIVLGTDNQVISASTDNNPVSNAIEVPMPIAVQAVGNPTSWIYANVEEVTTVETFSGLATVTSDVPILSTAPLSLSQAQINQKELLQQYYLNAANAPVTDSNGIVWDGGKESGSTIYLVCQMATQLGLSEITLYDAFNEPHTVSISEGMNIAAIIGAAYQVVYQKWQWVKSQIYSASATVDSVLSLTWPS